MTLVEENATKEEKPQWLLEMEGEGVDEFDQVDNSQPLEDNPPPWEANCRVDKRLLLSGLLHANLLPTLSTRGRVGFKRC